MKPAPQRFDERPFILLPRARFESSDRLTGEQQQQREAGGHKHNNSAIPWVMAAGS
jgi:hypothetical protein